MDERIKQQEEWVLRVVGNNTFEKRSQEAGEEQLKSMKGIIERLSNPCEWWRHPQIAALEGKERSEFENKLNSAYAFLWDTASKR